MASLVASHHSPGPFRSCHVETVTGRDIEFKEVTRVSVARNEDHLFVRGPSNAEVPLYGSPEVVVVARVQTQDCSRCRVPDDCAAVQADNDHVLAIRGETRRRHSTTRVERKGGRVVTGPDVEHAHSLR